MSAPDDGPNNLAADIAAHWIASRPTDVSEAEIREVLAWREREIDHGGPTAPWERANRGTLGERLCDMARDLRILMSAMACPGTASELAPEDVAVALLSIESRCTALARLTEVEEAAATYALERATGFVGDEAAE